MKDFDIFICYRGSCAESGTIGTKIYNGIKKYNVFFAPESLNKGDNFKSIVPKIMSSASIVIMLLDRDFFNNFGKEDDIVEYECREALANPDILFLPIYIGDFSFLNIDLSPFFNDEEIDRIKHINGIKYSGVYDFSVDRDLLPVLDNLFNGGTMAKQMSERSRERYYGASEQKEKNFLQIQQELLFDFDDEIFSEYMHGKSDLAVLDLGCNDGLQTVRRFGKDNRVSKIVGVDIDRTCIERARETYKDEKCTFIQADMEETESFQRELENALQDAQVRKFDIINISMVILHLKRPARFLRCVKRYLKQGGMLFIRDIDDGLNFAYPDTNSIFEKMTEICEYCDILGYRKSGRQIYSYLKDAGFSTVELKKVGLNTSKMTDDEKETLFEIYFGYIPTALKKTILRTNLLRAKHDLQWVESNLDDAREAFQTPGFLYSLGYMIYTAGV